MKKKIHLKKKREQSKDCSQLTASTCRSLESSEVLMLRPHPLQATPAQHGTPLMGPPYPAAP